MDYNAHTIYTMYKLGSLWSGIGSAVKAIGSDLASGAKAVGGFMKAYPMVPAGAALAGATALAAGMSMSQGNSERAKAIAAIQNLIAQVQQYPDVVSRLQDLIKGLQNNTVSLDQVVAILREGGLM